MFWDNDNEYSCNADFRKCERFKFFEFSKFKILANEKHLNELENIFEYCESTYIGK